MVENKYCKTVQKDIKIVVLLHVSNPLHFGVVFKRGFTVLKMFGNNSQKFEHDHCQKDWKNVKS